MSMAAGGTNDYKSDINITPLVDVVLVLLIIFMVITPLLQMGYDVKVPPKAQTDNPINTPADQLVVSLMPNGKIYLNKQELTAQQLAQQLGDNLKNRSNKTVFFSADDTVVYEEVAKLMDTVRNAGANNIGIVLETVSVQ
ncbi:MAG: biopolymer transporter ExbD [Acidobacteriota bacterium]